MLRPRRFQVKHLKFVLALLAIMTFQELVIAPFLTPCLAGSVQASATVRLLSDLKNPVEGTLGLEQSGVRLSGSLGNDNRQSYALDFLARSKDGFYAGAGVVGDRVGTGGYSSAASDTTLATVLHDHGKHLGDNHKRGSKTITQVNGSTILSLGSLDFDLRPAIFMGLSARHGLFFESRVIFGGEYAAENRTSFGVRF
jgi:hypothetical protein